MFRHPKINKGRFYIVTTAILLGVFIGIQSRSFEDIHQLLFRDMQSNIFQEIKILKEKNEDLKSEVSELQDTIVQLKDQNSALSAIDEQIIKYKKLTGDTAVFGPGVSVSINNKISTPWFIDLSNEFFNSGAQALSINGIRITNKSIGFDTLPQGQVVLNGSILNAPFEFKAIGESSILESNLSVDGGIFERLKASIPNLKIEIVKKDIIQID